MIPLTSASLQFSHSETEKSSAANVSIFVVLKLKSLEWKKAQKSCQCDNNYQKYTVLQLQKDPTHANEHTHTHTFVIQKHTSLNQLQV